MTGTVRHRRSVIQCAWAGRPLGGRGEASESGDLHLVATFDGGALVALIDGLGHGAEAASASEAAVRTLQASPSEPVLTLVRRCHESLRKTRGAAMSLASFRARDSMLSWAGIGNVDGVLFRADPLAEPRRQFLLLRSGVVGYRLPPLREDVLQVSRGDTLIMATDGIRSGFSEELPLQRNPQEIADLILTRHGRPSDDALVIVVRYRAEAG